MPKLLRSDLQRSWGALERLPDGAVVVDEFGAAWQQGVLRGRGFWYRAFDGDGISAFELAQRGKFRVIGGFDD